MKDELWYDAEILFYCGQKIIVRLRNENIVLLQHKVKNRLLAERNPNIKFDPFFEKDGVLIDTNSIMFIRETIVDDSDD